MRARLQMWLDRRPWYRRRRLAFLSHGLSAKVQRECTRRGGLSTWRQLIEHSRSFLARGWTAPGAYVWIIPAVILILFFIPAGWSFPYLNSESQARDFLEVLWQVDAAALALSVAVVAVALQVFSSRPSAPVQDSIRDAAVLPVVYVGAAALFVNLLVLLDVVRRPEGGPATWCAIVSAFALLLLPVLFSRAAQALDSSTILKARAERAAREARLAVEESLFDRIAYVLLRDLCEKSPVQLQFVVTPRVPTGWHMTRSHKAGTVQDVNVFQLARLARASKNSPSRG